jgi:hypothetical protein
VSDEPKSLVARHGASVARLSEAHLERREYALTVGMTPEMAQAYVEIADRTHAEPARVLVRGALIGAPLITACVLVVLWLTHLWGTDWRPAAIGVLVIGAPLSFIAAGPAIAKIIEAVRK